MPKYQILVVDDDKAFRLATKTLLEDEGFAVTLATNGKEALSLIETTTFDLVLSDMIMGEMNGIELLRVVKQRWAGLPVLMVTGVGSIQTAVEAMRLGAADYLTKPANNDEFVLKIRRALEFRDRERELVQLREELHSVYSVGNIVSRSPLMRDVIRAIQQVADTDVTVLLQGESGTGKELAARALHYTGNRRAGPFVAINCSAIPENLLESELFGYEKGAFTGATRQRTGKFEEAHTGTIFLDEIGEAPLAVQTRLLRVLQEKSFERVGGSATVSVDTRVLAATNRDLETMIREGDFREDLFYRLNVFPITLPPLRDRLEDIPLLAEHFLQKHSALTGGRVQHIAPGVIASMMNYGWRGNIRELENLITRAMLKSTGDTITAIELPQTAAGVEPGEEAAADVSFATPFKDYVATILRDAEQKYIVRMLRLCKGNINQIAKQMEIDRKTVYRKMTEYGIDPSEFRE